jgi:trimethylamine--corrinoid protein Co-methyltransferase
MDVDGTVRASVNADVGKAALLTDAMEEVDVCERSHARLVIDNDIFKMIRKVMQGMHIDDENLAVDIIKSVGPGGDFLMQDHTMKYMRTLPSAPNLIYRGNRENWLESGGKGLAERAAEKSAEIMANHKPVPLSDDAKSALRAIVEESDAEMEAMKKKI